MGNFIFEEINLMCIYNTGSRTGLIEALNLSLIHICQRHAVPQGHRHFL